MRLNSSTSVHGDALVLLPYRHEYVEVYHSWMKDPWLCEMTASEPLSLEDEYINQTEWIFDPSKATFIVFEKKSMDLMNIRSTMGMVGDVNIFLLDDDQIEEYDELSMKAQSGTLNSQTKIKLAEIMVMIADPSVRRCGYAMQAVSLMMEWGRRSLNIDGYVAKISDSNEASKRLFEKLGFRPVKNLQVFNEVHYVLGSGQGSKQVIEAVSAGFNYHEKECASVQ
jgi:RimJ/RimL family protein N-acetyltransferase